MDRPVLIIEAPELDDKALMSLQTFLHELTLAFESHYYTQLQRRDCLSATQTYDPIPEDQDPF